MTSLNVTVEVAPNRQVATADGVAAAGSQVTVDRAVAQAWIARGWAVAVPDRPKSSRARG